MLNLIKEQDDIDIMKLHATNLSEPKYQFLIEKREHIGKENLNSSKAFIE